MDQGVADRCDTSRPGGVDVCPVTPRLGKALAIQCGKDWLTYALGADLQPGPPVVGPATATSSGATVTVTVQPGGDPTEQQVTPNGPAIVMTFTLVQSGAHWVADDITAKFPTRPTLSDADSTTQPTDPGACVD